MAFIPASTRLELDDLRVDFAAEVLRNVLKDGWSVLNLAAGVADAFTDQTGVASLGGATYDGTGHAIGNPGVQSQVAQATGTAIGDMTMGSGVAACFDSNTIQIQSAGAYNAVTAGWVGKDWGAGNDKIITGFKVWASSNAGFDGPMAGATVTLALYGNSANNTGTATLLGSITAASTASALAQLMTGITATTAYRYHWIKISHAGSNSCAAEVQFFTSVSPANVTAQSIAFVPAAPASLARVVGLWQPVDSCTLGTDCLMDVTANAGTNWAAVALSDLGKFDASTRIIGGLASVTAGSSVAWRWRTASAKSQLLRGVFAQWK